MSINPYSAPQLEVQPPTHTPLSVVGTFRTGIAVFLDRFHVIVLLVMAFWLPVELLTSYLTFEVIPGDYQAASVLLTYLSELLVGSLVTGAVIHLAYANLQGESISGLQALARTASVWPLLMLNQVLSGLILTGAFLLLVLPGLYVMIRLAILDQVSVLEKRVGINAVTRSFDLTGQHFGFVFLVCLVCFLCSLLFYGAVTVLQVTFEELDTWYLDGAVSFLFDFVGTFYDICMVVIWVDLLREFKSPEIQLRVPMQ